MVSSRLLISFACVLFTCSTSLPLEAWGGNSTVNFRLTKVDWTKRPGPSRINPTRPETNDTTRDYTTWLDSTRPDPNPHDPPRTEPNRPNANESTRLDSNWHEPTRPERPDPTTQTTRPDRTTRHNPTRPSQKRRDRTWPDPNCPDSIPQPDPNDPTQLHQKRPDPPEPTRTELVHVTLAWARSSVSLPIWIWASASETFSSSMILTKDHGHYVSK